MKEKISILRYHSDQNGLLPNIQFSFRLGTTQQISRIVEFVNHNFNYNKHTGLVLLMLLKRLIQPGVKGII